MPKRKRKAGSLGYGNSLGKKDRSQQLEATHLAGLSHRHGSNPKLKGHAHGCAMWLVKKKETDPMDRAQKRNGQEQMARERGF
ncbi:hypothetical protein JRQ81_015541 [Phrynocephalus forsythii]|uniref:Uncharacterized protein n=1 Tax=Phrynocephalus forsythii TaxID=171643 RepID=A0A9Q0XWS8_9SAUR|nr:hypothetical protein JRQ81_015541 [Phrynocephalus forsythii]